MVRLEVLMRCNTKEICEVGGEVLRIYTFQRTVDASQPRVSRLHWRLGHLDESTDIRHRYLINGRWSLRSIAMERIITPDYYDRQ